MYPPPSRASATTPCKRNLSLLGVNQGSRLHRFARKYFHLMLLQFFLIFWQCGCVFSSLGSACSASGVGGTSFVVLYCLGLCVFGLILFAGFF
ncbi:hypothetical protein FKM82_030360 [Ascaphus truei]